MNIKCRESVPGIGIAKLKHHEQDGLQYIGSAKVDLTFDSMTPNE